MTGSALEVKNVTVRFGKTVVIRDLSFEVERGSSLAIIGPNGAGKTVLFKALIGAVPHEGTISWATDTRIGYVPQKLDIERDLPVTGGDFVHAKAIVSKAPPESVEHAIEVVGLSKALLQKPIGALSGGQFQRLLLAAAVVGSPTVLLLDEPTAGVDEAGQHTVYETLDRLRREQSMTTILISHDLSVVYGHADNVLCLSHTRACFGAPKAVLTPELLEEVYRAPIGYHVHDHGPRP